MKNSDPTNPLFRWSREAMDPASPEGLPPGFAARVLARALSMEPPERDWLLWLMPRAVAVAAVLAAIVSLPSFFTPRLPPEAELADLIFQSSFPSSP